MFGNVGLRSSFATKLTVSIGLAVAAGVAQAGAGQWHISPQYSYQWFDGDRNLDNGGLFGVGLEYQYSDRWAVELKYLDGSFDADDNSNNDADLSQLMVEGMYLLGKFQNIHPYLAVGMGHAEFDYDSGDDSETQLSIGPGLRYCFDERWSAKTDLRWVEGLDDSNHTGLLSVAVSYAFGGKAAKPVVPVAPVAPAAPVAPSDTDGDGVFDSSDKCPDTPAGAAVDEVGCAKKLSSTESIRLNVQFATDSADIKPAGMDEISKVASFMKKYPTVVGTIEGHTDDVGAASYNSSLSQRRAEAVRQALISTFNVDGDRLKAVGYGEEKPIADNSTAEGRQQNRRVVAVFEAETK